MKKDRKKMPGGGPDEKVQTPVLSIGPGIAVIAVVLALVFGGGLYFMWRFDMLPMNLSSSSGRTEPVSSVGDDIRFETADGLGEEVFFTPDFEAAAGDRDKILALLRSVRQHGSTRQVFYVFFGEGFGQTVTYWRDGARYRIESDRELVICDGETVYVRTEIDGFAPFENRWLVSDGQFTPESEVGISILDDIIAAVEASETVPEYSYDEREKVIVLSSIRADGLIRSVSISYETGVILYEAAATEDEKVLYRRFNTAWETDPNIPKGIFEIPRPAE